MISADDITIHEYSDTLTIALLNRLLSSSKEEVLIRFVGGYEMTQSLSINRHREMLADHVLSVFLCACLSLRNWKFYSHFDKYLEECIG